LENRQRDAAPLPEWKRPCRGRRGSAPRPNLDVHNVKERGATGAVVTGVRAHGPSTRTHARALPAHEESLDVLRLVLRAICPPASAAEGGPCAGYSGFSLELCSEPFIKLGTPQSPRAPTSSRPFGRSDRPVAALSAVAICDAMRIGILSWLAESVFSGRCV
jgi:hypothetical protein